MQPSLLDVAPPFDGPGLTADDQRRLSRQLAAVQAYMADGSWRSLTDISRAVGAPEASVSARLRDLRKPKHGGFTVERRHVLNGLFHYRVTR
jgi:hypothetical protein